MEQTMTETAKTVEGLEDALMTLEISSAWDGTAWQTRISALNVDGDKAAFIVEHQKWLENGESGIGKACTVGVFVDGKVHKVEFPAYRDMFSSSRDAWHYFYSSVENFSVTATGAVVTVNKGTKIEIPFVQ